MTQNKKLRRGQELETGVSLFLITPEFDPEQTLVAIYHPGMPYNHPGRVGLNIGKTYIQTFESRLRISPSAVFFYECKQFKVL